ncbi:hypothetical protein V5O48_018303 [Marasmius crinis-equi]|uniref:Uncharacterized protein n=1 Tax=Marasmius crinis-equi TaxID=585013 RepID=A0ABR3ELM4_9AGAR
MSSFARLTIFVFAAIATVNAAPVEAPNYQGLPGKVSPNMVPADKFPFKSRGLPLVGDLPLVGGLTKNLPIVGGAGGELPVVGELPIVGGLLGSRGLPLVGDLPLVGGLTKDLPIVGSAGVGELPVVGGLTKDLPIVGSLLGSRGLPIVGDLPVVGDLTKGLSSVTGFTKGLPVVGGLVSRHNQPGDADGPAAPAATGLCPCEAEGIVKDTMGQLTPLLQQITSITSAAASEAKSDITAQVAPLVHQVTSIIGDAKNKISALATQGAGQVSVDELANAVGPMVNSVLTSFGGIIHVCGNGGEDLKAVTDMLSGPTATLGGLVHSLTGIFGGDFTSSIIPQITGSLEMVQQLGGEALNSFNFLGLNLNGLLGKVTGAISSVAPVHL